MPPTFEIPSAVELRRMAQIRLPMMNKSSVIFEHFPDEFTKAPLLRWAQKDNFVGMQQARGINGKPPLVSMVGDKIYVADPGYYGEFIQLDEFTLTTRRDAAMLSGMPMGIADLVGEAQAQLQTRYWTLKAYILWQLVLNGVFSVIDKTGTIVFKASYTPQSFAPTVPWSTLATSTPIKDLQSIFQVPFGQSVDMGPDATLYINSLDANNLVNNTNAADLGGKKLNYGQSVASLAEVNTLLRGYNVPTVKVCDETYVAENGTITRFIATGKGVVIGKRSDGAAIGAYRHTNNINSMPGDPDGTYSRVAQSAEDEIPMYVRVHNGHNGGPVLFYPGAIVKVTGL